MLHDLVHVTEVGGLGLESNLQKGLNNVPVGH